MHLRVLCIKLFFSVIQTEAD